VDQQGARAPAQGELGSEAREPARAAFAPPGASEPQRKNFIQKLIAWGVNTVFEMPPGWDVKIIESNGVGNEVFQKEIDTSDLEFMVAIAGQLVTTTGGTGFANADIHRRIREDLIKSDGDALAYTINTQGIPQYIVAKYGDAALDSRWTSVEWDTSTPKELEAEARTLLSVAQAIGQLAEVLRGVDRRLNIDELATRFAIPLAPAANDADQGAADRPQPELAATVSEPATAKAIASLVARLPAAARRMPIDELVALQRRAA
jgi:phage gp29-like protein